MDDIPFAAASETDGKDGGGLVDPPPPDTSSGSAALKQRGAWALPLALLLPAALIALIDSMVLHRRGVGLSYLAVGAGVAASAGIASFAWGSWRRLLRSRPLWSERFNFASVFLLFLALYASTRSLGPTPYNEHVRLAYSLLHGHVWVDAPAWVESVPWRGHRYFVHPPLAAILMMPLVLLQGMNADQVAVSIAIGALDVALAWRLLGKFDLALSARLWLTLFFGAGTILWYEATQGTTWAVPLVVSAAPTLGALTELFGEARPWVVATMAALAALARYDLAVVWPVYGLALLCRGRRVRELAGMLPGFAFATLVYSIYSYARFGAFIDPGMWLWYRTDNFGLVRHPGLNGPFSVHNLPSNLYTLLFMGPVFSGSFPYIHPQGMGQAMMLTSPAFILALRPSLRRSMTLLMWCAVGLGMSGVLLFYANGFQQFGTRFYILVFPFLLALVAMGVEHRTDQLTKFLIAFSIILVSYGVWHIRMLGFG